MSQALLALVMRRGAKDNVTIVLVAMPDLSGRRTGRSSGNWSPGGACGACDVCCVALTIDDPALRKAQGYRCHHVVILGNGCGIYDVAAEDLPHVLLRLAAAALDPRCAAARYSPTCLVRLSDELPDAQGEP